MDNGTFRLVPNDYEVEGREGRGGDTVPDIQGTVLFYKVTEFNESRSKERAGGGEEDAYNGSGGE